MGRYEELNWFFLNKFLQLAPSCGNTTCPWHEICLGFINKVLWALSDLNSKRGMFINEIFVSGSAVLLHLS